jgi:hypothetical protein
LYITHEDTNEVIEIDIQFSNDGSGQVVTAPFNGQTFTLYSSTLNHIYLGFTQSAEYDIAININDLLAAWQQITPGVTYVNQKMYDENHNIVRNVNGTPLEFISVEFYVEGHLISSAPGLDNDIHTPLQLGDLTVVGIVNSTRVRQVYGNEIATVTWEAIRIENNNRTVRGT